MSASDLSDQGVMMPGARDDNSRARVALEEDSGSVPSSHVVTHSHPQFQVQGI